MKRLLIALCLVVLASWAAGQNLVDVTYDHPLTWTGHYIKWVKYTPVAVDSFTYVDSLVSEDGDTIAISWRSHPHKMKITPTTANGYTFVDTFLFAADSYVVTWTADASATVAEACDSLVAVGNRTTGVKDSIRFEDSATYVIARDKKDGVRDVAWTTACNARLADTASSVTSVAMVCDSMVAKWNATVAAAAITTAYDSTTLYHIRSDDSDEVYEIIDVADDSQEVAYITAALDWTDTTWYPISVPNYLSGWSQIYVALAYDATLGGMATKDTLWADLQRGVHSANATTYSTVKACILDHDSTEATALWDLEAYLRAATASDSLLRYPYLWLRVIDRQHLLDSGASLGVYQDSTWYQRIHIWVRGLK